MPSLPDQGWFRRRKYGIGWALQKSWQGWLLMLAYLALAAVGVAWFGEKPRVLSAYLVALFAVSVLVCWWKGDRSLWRGDALPAKNPPTSDPAR